MLIVFGRKPSAMALRATSIEKLAGLLKKLKQEKIPWYILGKGSNVILPDEDFDGCIIKLFSEEARISNQISCPINSRLLAY